MKRIVGFLSTTLLLLVLLVSCGSKADVGKFYKPKGNTPCPATTTLSDFNKMIDAAVKSDNATTMKMMGEGKILMLDVTLPYIITDQGGSWYKISADGKDLYVSQHMGTVQ